MKQDEQGKWNTLNTLDTQGNVNKQNTNIKYDTCNKQSKQHTQDKRKHYKDNIECGREHKTSRTHRRKEINGIEETS